MPLGGAPLFHSAGDDGGSAQDAPAIRRWSGRVGTSALSRNAPSSGWRGHKGIRFKVVHAYAFGHADRQDLKAIRAYALNEAGRRNSSQQATGQFLGRAPSAFMPGVEPFQRGEGSAGFGEVLRKQTGWLAPRSDALPHRLAAARPEPTESKELFLPTAPEAAVKLRRGHHWNEEFGTLRFRRACRKQQGLDFQGHIELRIFSKLVKPGIINARVQPRTCQLRPA